MARSITPPSQSWRTFLTNHVHQIAAAGFFVVPTATHRLLFVLVILAHERRRIVHIAVTRHPTAAWTAQQLREAFPWNQTPAISFTTEIVLVRPSWTRRRPWTSGTCAPHRGRRGRTPTSNDSSAPYSASALDHVIVLVSALTAWRTFVGPEKPTMCHVRDHSILVGRQNDRFANRLRMFAKRGTLRLLRSEWLSKGIAPQPKEMSGVSAEFRSYPSTLLARHRLTRRTGLLRAP